ncbi:hypothetical protein IKG24_01275, partial [Candidatus Saccharibacteria bacterium]|nr:hypothetical protein [Candidatus Saccharibacteria bacterium]
GLPPTDSGATHNTSLPLSTATPTRTGYTFKAWCLGTVSNNGTTCTGTEYSSGADFGIDQTTESIITLYAVWKLNTFNLTINFAGEGVDSVKVCKTTGNCSGDNLMGTVFTSGNVVSNLAYNTAYYLYPTFVSNHEFVSWAKTSGEGTLSSITIANPTYTIGNGNGTVTVTGKPSCTPISGTMQDFVPPASVSVCDFGTLTDSRDNQTYTVAKLAGKWWMVDNLNLGAVTLTQNLITANTNINNTITAAKFNGYKKTSGTGTYSAAEYISVSGTDSTSKTPYGTLYNYCAATAGTICTGSTSSNATYDICPKGWRLPVGGSSGEFQALYNNSSYNSNTKMRAPVSSGGAAFALAGNFGGGAPSSQGNAGYYWSSTRSNNTNIYYLYLNTTSVIPSNTINWALGGSIRCTFDTRTSFKKLQAGILSMQDIGKLSSNDYSTLKSQMVEGTSYTVYDSRDNQKYAIAKLADGEVWMLQNLKLGKTTDSITLTDILSDVPTTGFTLNGKSSDGVFNSYTIDGIPNQNNNSQYYCANDYGCYYNWYTATAGTGTTSVSSDGATVSHSICPAGWSLPTGGPNGQFKALYNKYPSASQMLVTPTSLTENTNGAAKPGFLLSGARNSNGNLATASYGYYWSNTAYSSETAYSLTLSASEVYPSDYEIDNGKYLGFAIRCVKKPPTMQDFTSTEATAMAENEVRTLTDSRDSQSYAVAKINGQVWMTQNLRFTGTSLDPSTSNVDSVKNISYGNLASGNSTDQARIADSGNANIGVYYNFAAASAMSITGSSTTAIADQSICPKNWGLPTLSEAQTLVSGTPSVFSPVLSGFYVNGSIAAQTSYGLWWTATPYDTATRHIIAYNQGSLLVDSSPGDNYRYDGFNIRCILK